MSRRRAIALVIGAVVAAGMLAGIVATSGDDGEAASGRIDVDEIVERVGRSIVRVVPEHRGSPSPSPAGLGFVLGDAGLIATAAHLVEGADQVRVVLPDGSTMVARIDGADAESDLALLQIDREGLEPAVFADGFELDVGTDVVVVGVGIQDGRPRGAPGAVTAIDAQRRRTDGSFQFELLRSDGRSATSDVGGPVVDRDGRVVGITLGSPDPGDGEGTVAVPGWLARSILARLSGAIG